MNMNHGRMTVLDYADNFVQNDKAVAALKNWSVAKNRCPLQRPKGKDFISNASFALDSKGGDEMYLTAANGSSTKLMTGYERDFYVFLNKIRVNPEAVTSAVKEEMKYIDDMVMTLPGSAPVMLWEGKSAWKDAIKRLATQGTAIPLGWSDGLALTAQDVCFDQARLRSDGVSLMERASKYGNAGEPLGHQ